MGFVGFGLELQLWSRVLENFILALMGLISKNPCLVFFVLVCAGFFNLCGPEL